MTIGITRAGWPLGAPGCCHPPAAGCDLGVNADGVALVFGLIIRIRRDQSPPVFARSHRFVQARAPGSPRTTRKKRWREPGSADVLTMMMPIVISFACVRRKVLQSGPRGTALDVAGTPIVALLAACRRELARFASGLDRRQRRIVGRGVRRLPRSCHRTSGRRLSDARRRGRRHDDRRAAQGIALSRSIGGWSPWGSGSQQDPQPSPPYGRRHRRAVRRGDGCRGGAAAIASAPGRSSFRT